LSVRKTSVVVTVGSPEPSDRTAVRSLSMESTGQKSLGRLGLWA
jgi:hypothetical protein